ncbi:hypothetical protein F2Q69_00004081 [Brassica cretica]|uniref:Transmembrane protein n=1 Tax=Brassica cretica TaxID=69181 RepID=A0A8S9NWH4_BRACR|nr:hypothetical protein F2Q69_00004081 [Brassica cretica]
MEKIDDTKKAGDWSLRFFLRNGFVSYLFRFAFNYSALFSVNWYLYPSLKISKFYSYLSLDNLKGFHHIGASACLSDPALRRRSSAQQLANSSLIQCDRQMGHSRANVIVLATSEKLLSVSIFYIANAVFVLARLR